MASVLWCHCGWHNAVCCHSSQEAAGEAGRQGERAARMSTSPNRSGARGRSPEHSQASAGHAASSQDTRYPPWLRMLESMGGRRGAEPGGKCRDVQCSYAGSGDDFVEQHWWVQGEQGVWEEHEGWWCGQPVLRFAKRQPVALSCVQARHLPTSHPNMCFNNNTQVLLLHLWPGGFQGLLCCVRLGLPCRPRSGVFRCVYV